MTIKVRIILLVLLSVACLSYILGSRSMADNQDWAEKQTLLTRMDTAEKLSSLVHELQKERGISSGYLVTQSQINNEGNLATLRFNTSREKSKLDSHTIQSLENLSKLDKVREAINQRQMTPMDSFNYYTTTIADLLDQIDMLAMYSRSPVLKNEFYAHSHLLHAKEYLGEIRACLNESLSKGFIDKEHATMVGRLLGLYQNHSKRFLRVASPGLAATYRSILAQSKVQASFEIINSALSERNTGDITADEWFAISSHTIDLLRNIEQQSMGNMLQETRNEISHAEWHFFIVIMAIIGVAVALILLSASTIYGLLSAFKTLVISIEDTIQTIDFTNRIPLYGKEKTPNFLYDFNELLAIAEKLKVDSDYFATTDSLTGSYNRLKLTQLIAVELQLEMRYGSGFALIMFDIDNFDRINVEFGRNAAGFVLKEITQMVSDIIRTTDVIARWGGDEFMILVPRGGCAAAAVLAEKLRAATEDHHFFLVPKVTASFGVSEYMPGDTMDSLCERVSKALNRAKLEGHNRIYVESVKSVATP